MEMEATAHASAPDWDALFTIAQAATAGYSPPLLHKYLANGKMERARRGIYPREVAIRRSSIPAYSDLAQTGA